MRARVGVAWRVAAAAAFVATAVLAVTLTRGAPLTTLASSHDTTSSMRDANGINGANLREPHPGGLPRCAPARLDISIADPPAPRVVAAHRHVNVAIDRFPVDFTNISGSTCTISGFPEVSAFQGAGTLVGNAAGLDTSVAARRVVLAPGATAHAAIVDSATAGRCRPVAVTGLRVVPPGDSVPRYVRHAMTACSAAGHAAPVFLHVRALQPGTGMPAGARSDRAEGRLADHLGGPAPLSSSP